MADTNGSNGTGPVALRSLRDELESLRIERKAAYRPARGRGDGAGLRLVSALVRLVPLGLFGAAGYYAYRQIDGVRSRPEVAVGLVQAMTVGEAEKLLSAKGYLKSHNQAAVGAKVTGRVQRLLVEEGDRVARGQLLAVLEHDDLAAQLESRKAMVRRAEGELKEAEADLEWQERKYRRSSNLLNRGGISPEEEDQCLADRNKAAARVAALRAAIDLQKALVREQEEAIRNMSIVAPFAGTVVSKNAEVGEMVTNMSLGGSQTRSSVATLADLGHMEVETDVAENFLARLAIVQPAEVAVSAVPNRHYRGRLTRIIPMSDRTRGTVKVRVEVLDPDERLFPELVATVHFLPDKALDRPDAGNPSLFAPKSALVEEGGHTYAWVVDGKPSVHKRRVEVVVTKDDLARVETGLKAGESVVLKPPKTLRDGETVRVAD